MAKLLPPAIQQWLDNNGDPLSGGKIHTYVAGTSTPLATYTDESEATPNTNPVILDSAGRASIWVSDARYKLVVADADDVVIDTIDDVTATIDAAADAEDAATEAAASALAAAASASTATTQAGIATTQATTATTQAGIATTQASNASTSASTATTQASNASSSASAASTSASNAATSATNANNSAIAAAASAASVLANPMTTPGDMIYGGSSGTPQRFAAGTAGQIPQSNGSSPPTWVAKNLRSIASKTTTYTLALTDHIINGSASGGAWTLTLPTVASASGYEFTIIKGDSSANAITIDGNGSETIQGSLTRKLSTQYESLTIYSNGSEWLIKEHSYPRGWVSFTPTGSWVSNTTYLGMRRRVGDSMEIIYQLNLTGAPTSTPLTLTIPSSLTIDTAKLPSTDTNQTLGICTLLDTGTLNYNQGKVQYASTTTVQPHYNATASESQGVTQSAPFTFASGDRVYVRVLVPITNWEG